MSSGNNFDTSGIIVFCIARYLIIGFFSHFTGISGFVFAKKKLDIQLGDRYAYGIGTKICVLLNFVHGFIIHE